MRTTIDIPDPLLRRVKEVLAERKMTLRSLVIDALERSLQDAPGEFVLRDASAGYGGEGPGVTARDVNNAIDELRKPGESW